MLKYLCRGLFFLIKSDTIEALIKKTSIFILIFFITTQFTANAENGKKVSFSLKNTSLKTVVNQIEKQTDYLFVYDEQAIDINQKININAKDNTVEEVLKNVLNSTDVSYSIEGKNIVLRKKQKSEQNIRQSTPAIRKVKGIVTDKSGEPIIGATVQESQSKAGTITDLNGNFSLDVSENSVLHVSYIGYSPIEIKVGNKQSFNIRLDEDILALDEVIVVGYGTQRKVNLTGAVTQVGAKELENRPVANMSQLLQGIVPNMNVTFNSGRPGVGGTFNIRGSTSISEGTSISGGAPLILVDGIETSLDRINPRDVESVSVLKDASASAVYGARASFGVILVTTKNGAENKARISYGTKIGRSRNTVSTDFESRGYYSALINDMFFRSYTGQNYTKYTDYDYEQLWLRVNDKTEHPSRPWVVVDKRDGRDNYIYYGNTDWYAYLFDDTRPSQEHSININGGNDKVKFFLSGNMFEQEGVFRISPDKFRSTNFRSKITAELHPWLLISNNTKYYRSVYDFPGYGSVNNLFSSMSVHGLASFVPVNPDGHPVYTNAITNYQLMDGWNALLTYNKHNNRDQHSEFATTFEATIKLMPDLELRGNYSFTHYNGQVINRSMNIPYSRFPEEVAYITTGIGQDRLYEKQVNHLYHAANVYASYEKSISDLHNLKLMIGGNYETKYLKDLSMSRDNLLTTELNDFELASGELTNINGGQNEYKIMGAFYRVNYDYNGKYLIESSGRLDGSSRFMPGHRFGFFPSASAGWRLSEEQFFSGLKSVIPNVKLRVSYGALGNQQVGYYDYIQTINPGQTLGYSFGDGQRVPAASVSSPNASDLTWEVVATANLGLDFSLFKGKMEFSGDIYSRETSGMLMPGKDLPATYGTGSPKMNAADLRTNGWEITLSWRDKFTLGSKPFNYNAKFILSDYTSTITKFDNPSKNLNNWYVGQRLGEIWGYVIDGYFASDEEAASYPVDQTSVNSIINSSAGSEKGLKAGDLKFVDLNEDKIISVARTLDDQGDQKVIGNSLPRYSYGLNLGADWNGIDFSVFLQGVGQQHWYPNRNAVGFWGPYSRPYTTFIGSDFLSKVWSEDNPNSYFPRPRGYIALNNTNRSLGVFNNRYLQDLSYLRVKNLNIGYTLPQSIVSKVKIERVRVYFSGENLYTFTKLDSKYIDPEQAASGGKADGDARTYGWSKTFSLGLDITF